MFWWETEHGYKLWMLWQEIVALGIACDDEIDLVTKINGVSEDTLNDIIWARTGLRDIEQVREEGE